MKHITTISLFLVLVSSNAKASLFNAFFDTFNNPTLNVVSSFNEIQDSGPVVSGSTTYDSITGSGTFDLLAALELIEGTQIHGVAITANTNGSLHLDGLVTFDMQPSTDYQFFGDISVDYNYDEDIDVTIFTYSPIVFSGSGIEGLLMDSGPFVGSFLDFEVTSTLLAFVDNPYPVYAPVPIPTTAWLFGSGLLGLIGIARRKKA